MLGETLLNDSLVATVLVFRDASERVDDLLGLGGENGFG